MPRQEWTGIQPMGEVFLLTFLFIGLVRDDDYSLRWNVSLCRDILLKTGLETVCNRDERLPYRWQGLRIQFNLGGAVEQHPLE